MSNTIAGLLRDVEEAIDDAVYGDGTKENAHAAARALAVGAQVAMRDRVAEFLDNEISAGRTDFTGDDVCALQPEQAGGNDEQP